MAALLLGGFSLGCSGIPDQAYRLPPSPLSERDAQTRFFDASDEAEILQASAALLQDMEYNIDTVEAPLGVLTASKVVDADDAQQQALLVSAEVALALLSILSGSTPDVGLHNQADDQFNLTLTLVVLPRLGVEGQFVVRATLQSTLIDKSGKYKEVKIIKDPSIYQSIFAKLSESLSLERAGQ